MIIDTQSPEFVQTSLILSATALIVILFMVCNKMCSYYDARKTKRSNTLKEYYFNAKNADRDRTRRFYVGELLTYGIENCLFTADSRREFAYYLRKAYDVDQSYPIKPIDTNESSAGSK